MRWLDDTVIAIVVLGTRRPFVLRPRAEGGVPVERVPAGTAPDDVVLMPGEGDMLSWAARVSASGCTACPGVDRPSAHLADMAMDEPSWTTRHQSHLLRREAVHRCSTPARARAAVGLQDNDGPRYRRERLMDDTLYGTRNQRGEWSPHQGVRVRALGRVAAATEGTAALAVRLPRLHPSVQPLVCGCGDRRLVLRYALRETMSSFGARWIATILVRNAVVLIAWYGVFHLRL